MIPTSGATAAYVRRSPNSDRSSVAYSRSNDVVLPVEPAAGLGDPDQQIDEHGPEERVVGGRVRAGVRARVDRSGRLAPELLEREHRVGALAQQVRALLHEAAHERSVLVESRARRTVVLLEGERQLPAEGVELAEQERERAERVPAERGVELG